MTFYTVQNPEMKPGELRFYGGSDDCIEVDGWLSEEFNADRATFRIGGKLLLTLEYEKSGSWSVKFALVGEGDGEGDEPIPWNMNVEHEGCTIVATVACPVGTHLEVDIPPRKED